MDDTNFFSLPSPPRPAPPMPLPHLLMGLDAVAHALGLDPMTDLEALYQTTAPGIDLPGAVDEAGPSGYVSSPERAVQEGTAAPKPGSSGTPPQASTEEAAAGENSPVRLDCGASPRGLTESGFFFGPTDTSAEGASYAIVAPPMEGGELISEQPSSSPARALIEDSPRLPSPGGVPSPTDSPPRPSVGARLSGTSSLGDSSLPHHHCRGTARPRLVLPDSPPSSTSVPPTGHE